MKLKKRVKSKKCIVCQTEFFIKCSAKSQRGKELRQGNCITCSKECSKIYTRNRKKILKGSIKK